MSMNGRWYSNGEYAPTGDFTSWHTRARGLPRPQAFRNNSRAGSLIEVQNVFDPKLLARRKTSTTASVRECTPNGCQGGAPHPLAKLNWGPSRSGTGWRP